MTCAQIEIMQCDLPHTLYKRSKSEGKKGKDAPVRANDPAFALQQAAYEKKLARLRAKAEGKEPLTMNDIFGK